MGLKKSRAFTRAFYGAIIPTVNSWMILPVDAPGVYIILESSLKLSELYEHPGRLLENLR